MEIIAPLVVASRTVLIAVGKAFVAALWETYKSKIVLGAAIFGFSVSGLAMIIGSRVVTGWNQVALLGFGTSLLIVGTVELGIIGVLHKIIEPDRTENLISDLSENLAQRFAALEGWLGMPPFQPTQVVVKVPGKSQAASEQALITPEVAAALRKVVGRPDEGAAGTDRGD
jgi:hypothetical protein